MPIVIDRAYPLFVLVAWAVSTVAWGLVEVPEAVQAGLSASGGTADSPSVTVTLSAAAGIPVGAASPCNRGGRIALGPTVRRELPVPVVLRIDKNPTDAVSVVLAWTGDAPRFDVLRVISPDDFLSGPSPFARSLDCSVADEEPRQSPIVFYLVREVNGVTAGPGDAKLYGPSRSSASPVPSGGCRHDGG